MKIVCHNAQHIGSRARQEDAFIFSDTDHASSVENGGVVAVVADGMGGLQRGDEASAVAVRIFLDRYSAVATPSTIDDAMREALTAANEAVFQQARAAGTAGATGTTLAAAVIRETRLHWISTGDSRVYLYRRGALRQLSADHIFAVELDKAAQAGKISPASAAEHPERESLTSCLGMATIPHTDEGVIDGLTADDLVLVCSDGLYKSLGEKEIARVLAAPGEDPAGALLDAVLERSQSHQDNVTILTMTVAPQQPANWLRSLFLFLFLLLAAAPLHAQFPLDSCEAMTVRVIANTEEGYFTGSGLIAGGGKYVITAAHVVTEGAFRVRTRRGVEIDAGLMWYSAEKDLAILKLRWSVRVPRPVYQPKKSVRKAETVYALGFPAQADRSVESADQVKVTRGIISAIVQDEGGRGLYQIDAPINPGNSGGPVFNELGQVIGIAIEKPMASVYKPERRRNNPSRIDMAVERVPTSEGVGWAVQIEEILPALSKLEISFNSAEQAVRVQPSTLMRIWKDNPFLILTLGGLMLLVVTTAIIARARRHRSDMRGVLTRGNGGTQGASTLPLLIGASGVHAGKRFPLDHGDIVIGRDPGVSNLILDSRAVSKKHCVVTHHADERCFLVEDCASTNGTYLSGGKRLIQHVKVILRDGDSFYVADPAQSFTVRYDRLQ
jgi:serine/threonine protein phosphatase PrpC